MIDNYAMKAKWTFYCEYHFRGIIEKMQGSHFEI